MAGDALYVLRLCRVYSLDHSFAPDFFRVTPVRRLCISNKLHENHENQVSMMFFLGLQSPSVFVSINV